MKSLKKILSIVLALAMVLAMTAITGMAATKGSITINNAADGQEYKIYKILDASVNDSGGIDYDITSVVDDLKDYANKLLALSNKYAEKAKNLSPRMTGGKAPRPADQPLGSLSRVMLSYFPEKQWSFVTEKRSF